MDWNKPTEPATDNQRCLIILDNYHVEIATYSANKSDWYYDNNEFQNDIDNTNPVIGWSSMETIEADFDENRIEWSDEHE